MTIEQIANKIESNLQDLKVGVVANTGIDTEDVITVGIDVEDYDKSQIGLIEDIVRKELKGYSDVEIEYNKDGDMILIDFYHVSEYSDRELIKAVTDTIWIVNSNVNLHRTESLKEARLTLDKVLKDLQNGEDFPFVNGIFTLSDFEKDDNFFIPNSSWKTFPKKRPSTNSWTCKAQFKVKEDEWKGCIITCNLPWDENLEAMNKTWDDITSYMLLVQGVYIDGTFHEKKETSIKERYTVTGDRYADQILTLLIEYVEDKYAMSIDKFDPFYNGCDLDKFVELVYEEFPMTVDTPNAEYDVEWAWEKFINSKDGKKAVEWIADNEVIDSAYFLDDLDKATIAETQDFVEEAVDEFCSKNAVGKKLSKADKKILIDTIKDADIGKFTNGYSWSADEFTAIEMTDHDGEHNYNDIRKGENDYLKYAKDGLLVASWITDFKDEEVAVLYSVDLEEIAKNAL